MISNNVTGPGRVVYMPFFILTALKMTIEFMIII
jgi:hypothetical protein